MFVLTTNGLWHIKQVAKFWSLATIKRDMRRITNPEIMQVKKNKDRFPEYLKPGYFLHSYAMTKFTLKARQTLRATSFSMEVSMTG